LEADYLELNQRREELQRQREQLSQQEASTGGDNAPLTAPLPAESEPTEELGFQDISDKSPVDLESVLQGMGSVGLLRDDEQAEPEPIEEPTPEHADAVPATPESVSCAEDDEEDESIDNYMARLMQRVAGAPANAPPVETQPDPAQADVADADEPQVNRLPDEANQIDISSPPRPSEPVDLSPRAVAPEAGGGLAAMRELAKLSAQGHISKHSRRQLSVSARTKLAVTTLGITTAGILLWIWWAWGTSPIVFYGAMAGLLVAVLWGVQYAIATGRLIFDKSGRLDIDRQADHGDELTEPGDENDAPQIDANDC
jgi:hypothetical protein